MACQVQYTEIAVTPVDPAKLLPILAAVRSAAAGTVPGTAIDGAVATGKEEVSGSRYPTAPVRPSTGGTATAAVAHFASPPSRVEFDDMRERSSSGVGEEGRS